MNYPGALGSLYLFYVLALLPWMALRSKKKLLPPSGGTDGAAPPVPSRVKIFTSTLVSLGGLFYLSWLTGGTFGYEVFAAGRIGAREVLAGIAAFAFYLGAALLSRALRPPAEQRTMAVYRLIPRSPAEWTLYVALSLAAGVAEEAAYRGVLVALLAYALGSVWLAVLLSAAAFAAAHALQGWKSAVLIFFMALCMHALVGFTGTLVVAMVVHAFYDLVAGGLGAWRIRTGQVDG